MNGIGKGSGVSTSRGVGRDRTGPPTRNGEGLGKTKQSPIKKGKSYQLKQEGEWWQRSQSPERFEDEHSASWSQLSWRDRPQGDIKVDQLRDNRSRHKFGECVVTILSWNRAAKKRTGHICTIPRIGTHT
jgi:hypothetical protein